MYALLHTRHFFLTFIQVFKPKQRRSFTKFFSSPKELSFGKFSSVYTHFSRWKSTLFLLYHIKTSITINNCILSRYINYFYVFCNNFLVIFYWWLIENRRREEKISTIVAFVLRLYAYLSFFNQLATDCLEKSKTNRARHRNTYVNFCVYTVCGWHNSQLTLLHIPGINTENK